MNELIKDLKRIIHSLGLLAAGGHVNGYSEMVSEIDRLQNEAEICFEAFEGVMKLIFEEKVTIPISGVIEDPNHVDEGGE